MKTNSITYKHFEKLVDEIIKWFPTTKVNENTTTTYMVCNLDFMVWTSVTFVTLPSGKTALMVGIPGNKHHVWAETQKEFKCIKKQLIDACIKYHRHR